MGNHVKTDLRDGVTTVTTRDGLFDELPETDGSAPLAAEVVLEFRNAITGAAAVVVDLRRAGEINKRTLSVAFQFARSLAASGARQALCGSANLRTIWALCKGDRVSPCFEDLAAAVESVRGVASDAERTSPPGAAT